MPTQISHDPFGRFALVRETVHGSKGLCCAWCGQWGNIDGRLFRYGVENDQRPGRIEWQGKLFCGVGCMRAYHY